MPLTLHPDSIELVRRLFAESTLLLENAHTAAVHGQGAVSDTCSYSDCADQLHASAKDLRTLAAAVRVLLNQTEAESQNKVHDRQD